MTLISAPYIQRNLLALPGKAGKPKFLWPTGDTVNLLTKLFKKEPKVEVRTVVRLNVLVMQQLRRQAGSTCAVTTATTDLMAGYQLGMNHVLNILQEGFVISDT